MHSANTPHEISPRGGNLFPPGEHFQQNFCSKRELASQQTELFSPGVGIRVFFSTGVGDHFSFLSSVDDMTLLMALMFQ